jgi:hypothetical protein
MMERRWRRRRRYVSLALAPTVVLSLWGVASIGRDAQQGLLNQLDLTGALFMIGKFLIGACLSHSTAGTAYGPAGAFVILRRGD